MLFTIVLNITAASRFSVMGSNTGVLTTECFTTGTSSMLLYSMPSIYIHSISCICKTQRVFCCRMEAIRSGITISAMFSPTSNVSLLSALSSTCLQYRWCIDITLIVKKYIPQTEHIQFSNFPNLS